MAVFKSQVMPLRCSDDILSVRQFIRALAVANGFNLVEQTKLITAASELARNTVAYGGGGELILELLNESDRVGVRLTFQDHGPGIPDLELALKDGYTTSGGLGLGLGGARRLSNEFSIVSRPGEGTRVSITRWRSEL